MEIGEEIIVSLPKQKPFKAIYLGETFNENLIRIKIKSDYPKFGFINKKWIK